MANEVVRVYLKDADNLYYYFWADVSSDGSVIVGVPTAKEEKLAILSGPEMESSSDGVYTEGYQGNVKISFHASGMYKLNCNIGKSLKSLDRATVSGTPLTEISEPKLMAEVLIPENFPISLKTPKNGDAVIEFSNVEESPSRCSIFCLPNEQVAANINKRFLSTSAWEVLVPLENDTHTWVFVFRKSREDSCYPNTMYICLTENIRWGVEV